MEVKERNPGVESKTHRGGGGAGEASTAFVDYSLYKKNNN